MSGRYSRPRVPWRRTGKQPKTETTRNHRWTCPHSGKWSYVSRKDARRAGRIAHPNDPQIVPYRCPQDEQHWHIGHLGPGGRDFYRREAS